MHFDLELAQLGNFVAPLVGRGPRDSERDSKLLASAKKVDRVLCLHSAIVRCLTCKVKPSFQRLLLTIRVSCLTIAATVRECIKPLTKDPASLTVLHLTESSAWPACLDKPRPAKALLSEPLLLSALWHSLDVKSIAHVWRQYVALPDPRHLPPTTPRRTLNSSKAPP